jgi:purine-binding chemotaxis protein CheW
VSGTSAGPSETALELRRAFDAGFARAPAAAGAAAEDLLAVGIAGDPYAVRLSEIAGLFKDRAITELPSPFPDFLGIAGIQGRLVPVYDLRVLLGYAPAALPRWLLLVLAPEPLGLACDAFAGQLRVTEELMAAAPAGSRRHVSQAVCTNPLRPVLDVASIVEAVRSRARPGGPTKER